MTAHLSKWLSFLRTTAIGGILFLLPIFVVAGLVAYVYQFAVALHGHLKPWIPFSSFTSIALLFAIGLGVVLAGCFIAGLLARRAISIKFAGTIEKQLLKVFPKYGIYKDLLAGRIGGEQNLPSLTPVLVKREGVICVAFQADQLANGLVVVYFPGAPDAWNGSIGLVQLADVQSIQMPFHELMGICERLGRYSSSHLNPMFASPVPTSRPDVVAPVS